MRMGRVSSEDIYDFGQNCAVRFVAIAVVVAVVIVLF